MITTNKDTTDHRGESDYRSGLSTDERTRWILLSGGFYPSRSRTRRFPVHGTLYPLGTKCLDEHVVVRKTRRCRLRLLRHDNLGSAFPPQHIHADILRMTFEREVHDRVADPQILDFNALQERRQDRL